METTAERLQRIAQVAHERRRSLVAGAQQAGERHEDLLAESTTIRQDLATAAAEEAEARATAERAEIALRALEDEERSLAEQEALPVEGVIATLRGDLGALEAAAERDRRESEAAGRRVEVLTDAISRDQTTVEQLTAEIRILDKETGGRQAAYDEARLHRDSVRARRARGLTGVALLRPPPPPPDTTETRRPRGDVRAGSLPATRGYAGRPGYYTRGYQAPRRRYRGGGYRGGK